MRRLSWAVVAVALLLSGCSGGDDSDPTSGDASASVDPGPDIAYGDLDLVPAVSTYTRDYYDDSAAVQKYAAYVGTPNGDRVSVEATDYVNDLDGTTTPGSVPTYWDDATDRKTYANGWTCGTLSTGLACRRALTDGMLEVTCDSDECTLDRDALADLVGLLYTAFSGGSTSGGSSDPPQPCDGVTVDAVTKTLGSFLGDGDVSLELDASELGEFYTCYVHLPADSLDRSEAELQVVRHDYSADTRSGSAACSFGGTDPDEVIGSATACLKGAGGEVTSTPADDGDGGTVAGTAEVVHAEEGDFWWEVSLTDDTIDPELFDALTDFARTLPAS